MIAGRRKPFRTELSAGEYALIREMGDEYLAQVPRRIALPDPSEREIVQVACDDKRVTVTMASGSSYSLPLFGRLITASADERAMWTRASDHSVIYWPRLNEQRNVVDLFE